MVLKRRSGRKLWLIVAMAVLALVLLASTTLYLVKRHQDGVANKIYNKEETVKLPDLAVKITDVELKDISFDIPQDKLARFGGLDTNEDCSLLPETTYPTDSSILTFDEDARERATPTRKFCNWRNDSRNELRSYRDENREVTINYTIDADKSVRGDAIDFTLMPDSGRVIDKKATLFSYDPLLSKKYAPAFDFEYHQYHESGVGGDINKGLTRSGWLSSDLRKSEKVVDVRVTYDKDGKTHSRVIRIDLENL